MVFEITPTFYADQEIVTTYNLRGVNFNQIPSDAIGIFARNNEEPLEYIDTLEQSWLFDITNKTDSEIELKQRQETYHWGNNYLGAIVSPDRETIYWINDSKPLP